MNNTLGYIHFFVTLAGAYLIFWPMHYEGFAGMPRRYYDYSAWESFKQFDSLNAFISVVVIIVFFTQLLFVFNFFISIFKGRRVTSQNPWGATTLEWTTPIHPGHGNWKEIFLKFTAGRMTIKMMATEAILSRKTFR
jgi:cytochrome c oxidase subunit 1